MTDILTDAVIEKAALAMRNRPPGSISGDLGYYRLSVRAALEAALPDIIEACAKVADAHAEASAKFANTVLQQGKHTWAAELEERMDAADDVASAIRSLSPEEKTS